MKQISFSYVEYAGRRERFLIEMNQVVPWMGLIYEKEVVMLGLEDGPLSWSKRLFCKDADPIEMYHMREVRYVNHASYLSGGHIMLTADDFKGLNPGDKVQIRLDPESRATQWVFTRFLLGD